MCPREFATRCIALTRLFRHGILRFSGPVSWVVLSHPMVASNLTRSERQSANADRGRCSAWGMRHHLFISSPRILRHRSAQISENWRQSANSTEQMRLPVSDVAGDRLKFLHAPDLEGVVRGGGIGAHNHIFPLIHLVAE